MILCVINKYICSIRKREFQVLIMNEEVGLRRYALDTTVGYSVLMIIKNKKAKRTTTIFLHYKLLLNQVIHMRWRQYRFQTNKIHHKNFTSLSLHRRWSCLNHKCFYDMTKHYFGTKIDRLGNASRTKSSVGTGQVSSIPHSYEKKALGNIWLHKDKR